MLRLLLIACLMLPSAAAARGFTFSDLWDARVRRPIPDGMASYYATPQRTASGERFRPFNRRDPTCAIWGEPFHRKLRVVRLDDPSKSTICRVNDRGPHKSLDRVIDLSPVGMRQIGCIEQGLCPVRVERLVNYDR